MPCGGEVNTEHESIYIQVFTTPGISDTHIYIYAAWVRLSAGPKNIKKLPILALFAAKHGRDVERSSHRAQQP